LVGLHLGGQVGHGFDAVQIPALLEPEIRIARQRRDRGGRDAFDEVFAVDIIGFGGVPLENVEPSQVPGVTGIGRRADELFDFFGQLDALIERSLVADDPLDICVEDVRVMGILGGVFDKKLGRLVFGDRAPKVVEASEQRIFILKEFAFRIFGDKGPQGRRVVLAAEEGDSAQGLFGGFGIGDYGLEIVVIKGTGRSGRVQRNDLAVELFCFITSRFALLDLLSKLENDLDVVGFFGVPVIESPIRICPGESFLDFLQKEVGRGPIASDPVQFLTVFVDKKDGRRPADFEPLEYGVPDFIAAASSVKDKVFSEEFGVFGIGVELLTQQSAGPSAAREKFNVEEFVFLFGLG